jgi:acyl-CoA hydrolase
MPEPLPAKPVSASHVEMVQLILPHDANVIGNALGGVVMHHMDICAAICAQRHAGRVCVTASVDRIDFESPVHVGEVMVLLGAVNFAGRTSMEIGVLCMAEDARTGIRRHTASAYFTFVALGDDGKPQPVPPVLPVTPAEVRRFEAARRRRDDRIAARRDERPRNDNERSPS